MRIIAGTLRGKTLAAPPGLVTRPTAQRMRQSLFDMLVHAPWGGRTLLEGASVLDVFAGTGAFGLEAVSRGAAGATFIENDVAAIAALRANIAACRSEARARVVAADALHPPRGSAQTIVFMDPPYGQGLVPLAIAALRRAGWIAADTLLIAEAGRLDEVAPGGSVLAQRAHGVTKVIVWRED
jgi:16S rRNA (guanine966-N2)-methyltransferase